MHIYFKKIKTGKKGLLPVFLMLVIVSAVFGLSLIERLPYLGNLMASDCRLTFDTSTFIYNWIDQGFFNISGRMYMAPSSIETPGGDQLYTSYPPGFMIVPYLLCVITGNEGTVAFVQSWNLFNNYILALLIAYIIYFIYRKTDFVNRYWGAALGALGGILTIFVPGLYYYMEFEYFADIAAFVPMAALILTEILLEDAEGRAKKILYWVQAFFVFAAAFTDFVCYFLIFVIWVVRIVRGRYKSFKDFVIQTLKYVWPMLLAIALFMLYLLWAAGSIEPFLSRYSQRSSFELNAAWLKKIGYWLYSLMGLKLLLVVTASCALYGITSLAGIFFHKRDKDIGKLIGWGAIVLLPMIMVTVVLSEHAYYHDFPMLRFVFPLVILPLGVLPVLIYKLLSVLFKPEGAKLNKSKIAVSCVAVFCAVIFAAVAYAERTIYLEVKLTYVFDFEPQKFLYENTEYEDYVFITPEQLDITYPSVYARKPVHSMTVIDSLYNKVEKLPDEANVCVLYVKNPQKALSETTEDIINIVSLMEVKYSGDDYDFYRCTKEEFLNILTELGLDSAD